MRKEINSSSTGKKKEKYTKYGDSFFLWGIPICWAFIYIYIKDFNILINDPMYKLFLVLFIIGIGIDFYLKKNNKTIQKSLLKMITDSEKRFNK